MKRRYCKNLFEKKREQSVHPCQQGLDALPKFAFQLLNAIGDMLQILPAVEPSARVSHRSSGCGAAICLPHEHSRSLRAEAFVTRISKCSCRVYYFWCFSNALFCLKRMVTTEHMHIKMIFSTDKHIF